VFPWMPVQERAPLTVDETILSWNVTNWITVILMAAIGFFLLGLIQKAVANRAGGGDASS
jgi:hypothetical protein